MTNRYVAGMLYVGSGIVDIKATGVEARPNRSCD